MLLKHLSRKKQCFSKLQEIDNIKILQLNKIEQYNKNTYKIPFHTKPSYTEPSHTEPSHTEPSYTKPSHTELENNEVIKINNLYKCSDCNKFFKKKEYLDKHLKKSCKMIINFNNIYIFPNNTLGKYIYKTKNSGDIYIVQTDYINNNYYKIGITNNISKRIGNYRCGNIYEPRLHYYFNCPDILKFDKILTPLNI
jgi:hypothetical protein